MARRPLPLPVASSKLIKPHQPPRVDWTHACNRPRVTSQFVEIPSIFTRIETLSLRNLSSGLSMTVLTFTTTAIGGSTTLRVGGSPRQSHSSNICLV